MERLPVQACKVTIDGKEYALSFNMAAVEYLEDHEITLDNLDKIIPGKKHGLRLTKLAHILYAGIGMGKSGMTVEELFEKTKGLISMGDTTKNPLLIAAGAYAKYFVGPPEILKNSPGEVEMSKK